ncbi:uncharacterized protein [Nicotiana sylvestris]|uniref:uncharacterized protein n=1 Tax=Nicotiana sylvestris TaxID=4096 RepID=UPI00388C3FE5
MDEWIGNLKTYEMKRKKDSEKREPKKEKNLVLKAKNSDSSDEDSDMAHLTKRFQKMDLAAWGDSSSESEREPDVEYSSMMAVETKAMKYDSLFTMMAQYDEDEEDEDDEVNFRDFHLDNDKEILTLELGETKQSRDNLVVCLVELNETIANIKKEKEALNEKINSVENERDDLMVVVVDLKETIEGLSNEKNTLEEKISATDQERDDFLVIITNLEETIEGLNIEHKTGILGKGNEVASETHIKLEHELNNVKTSLCGELEKNWQLQAGLEKVKIDRDKSLKWTWSSDAVTTMYLNNSENRQGIGFQREKTPYNPHNKYVTIPDNWLCTYCGNNGHFKENYQARTLVPRTKDETIEVFKAIVKKIQVKIKLKVVCIRSDHGTEYDNSKLYDLVTKKIGIKHNFSAPRTPQQNGIAERKNRTGRHGMDNAHRQWNRQKCLGKSSKYCFLLGEQVYDQKTKDNSSENLLDQKFHVLDKKKDQHGKFNSKAMKESFWDTLHKAEITKSTAKGTLSGRKCSWGDSPYLVRYADVNDAGYLVDRKSTSGMAHLP